MNINAGAVTGFSSVVTVLAVAVTLLLLTPLLFYLPQATLAAVIMMAVAGLINVKPMLHAWQANRHDGIVTVVAFVFTLALAPELEMGILFGMLLSLDAIAVPHDETARRLSGPQRGNTARGSRRRGHPGRQTNRTNAFRRLTGVRQRGLFRRATAEDAGIDTGAEGADH